MGPCGEIELSEGLIVAKRHIHFAPEDAQRMNVVNGEIVMVKVETEGRSLIFDDVVCRVSPSYALACHLDTDEANAAGIPGSCYGTVIKK